MNADEIRAAVRQLLSERHVTFSARYMGETVRENDWHCDAWRVKFSLGTNADGFKLPEFDGKPAQFETDYFTGLGNRKPVKGAPADSGNPRTLLREQWEKQYVKPVTPDAAGVLHSLVLDAGAIYMSFDDWCADYDDNNDSIKAFNTYQLCCGIGKDLARIFDGETLNKLRELLQDY